MLLFLPPLGVAPIGQRARRKHFPHTPANELLGSPVVMYTTGSVCPAHGQLIHGYGAQQSVWNCTFPTHAGAFNGMCAKWEFLKMTPVMPI